MASTDRAGAGSYGVGNNETSYREVTRKGTFGEGAVTSQGENSGVGSMYAAELNERPNMSNPRNRGPERAPSRDGAARIPAVSMDSRNTGRL